MNRLLIYSIVLLLLCTAKGYSQNGEKVYRFLNLPTSTHVNAIGGSNVSLVDNDISLVFHNPALLGDEMDMNVSVNYLSYIADIASGSIVFGKSINEVSSFAAGINYLDYGDFDLAGIEGIRDGTFSAKDIVVNAIYSRDLTRFLRAGITGKFIYSSYEEYTSTAIGFDLGLSYYNEDKSFSAGLTIKNVGTQLSSYSEDKVGLPWDVQLGLTKKIANAPIRFSLTGVYLTQWNFEKINEANGIEAKDDNFLKTFFKHMVFGVDLIPTQNMWIGVGYSPKIHSDMKLQDGNGFAGWNAGAGVRIKRFNVGFSFAKYHPSANSYHFSLGVDLSKL